MINDAVQVTPVGDYTPQETEALYARYGRLMIELDPNVREMFSKMLLADSLSGYQNELDSSFKKNWEDAVVQDENKRNYMKAWRPLNRLELFLHMNHCEHDLHWSFKQLSKKLKNLENPTEAKTLLSSMSKKDRKIWEIKI